MTIPRLEIKHFVRDTLGCTCPEAVFKEIEFQKETGELWERKIHVGGRLLIYILTCSTRTVVANSA